MGSLVSVIQEFKRRIKWKHKDSFIRIFKSKPKTQGQRSCKSQQLLGRKQGRERQLSHVIEVGYMADKQPGPGKEASEKE